MSKPTPSLRRPASWTPTRATLLLLAAAIGGLALLALFSAPPAHAQRQERPPVVSVTPDSAVVDGGGSVVLDATASDPDNDPMTYSWTTGPDVGVFANASTPDTTWTAPPGVRQRAAGYPHAHRQRRTRRICHCHRRGDSP